MSGGKCLVKRTRSDLASGGFLEYLRSESFRVVNQDRRHLGDIDWHPSQMRSDSVGLMIDIVSQVLDVRTWDDATVAVDVPFARKSRK